MPMATTDAACRAVLRHKSLGREIPSERRETTPEHLTDFAAVERHSLLELEGPAHDRLRTPVLAALTRERIQSLAPQISQIADDLLDRVPGPDFDLVAHFAQRLPVIVIGRLFGISDERAEDILVWSNAMVGMYQARRDLELEVTANEAARDFRAFLLPLIDERRAEPREDLLSYLLQARTTSSLLTEDEIVSLAILLLNAGHEATVNMIGNATVTLIGFSGRKEALAPEAIASTVEECIRFRPPLHIFTRHVYEDVEIEGERFLKGDEIGCLLGSACHDDAVWPDATTFDPFRATRGHVAFGAGSHFCVGAPLARLELQIALPALFSRFPRLSLAEPPEIADLYHFHGHSRIMVKTG